jgi:hypothetical protein
LELERRDGPRFSFRGLGPSLVSEGWFSIMVTMMVLSLLDVLHLVINTSLGEVTVLSLKRAANHAFSSMVVVPLL